VKKRSLHGGINKHFEPFYNAVSCQLKGFNNWFLQRFGKLMLQTGQIEFQSDEANQRVEQQMPTKPKQILCLDKVINRLLKMKISKIG
jgi:hypothetical protein